MQTAIKQTLSDLHFQFLPRFASYLLEQHLEAYCRYQIELFKNLQIPLLKSFEELSDAELLQLSMAVNAEFLTYLAQNNARGQIESSIKKWQENALPRLDKHAIVTEDITYLTYARRQVFLHFLPLYCPGTAAMLALLKEIDLFLLEAETASTNVHVNLLKEEINAHTHLLQKITNTLPGAVYVFDVVHFKGVYANNNLGAVIGYTQEELNAFGENAIGQLLHPDDREDMTAHLARVRASADGEISNYKYRVRGKDGVYHWICNYEAPFKRGDDGAVVQTIGITLNIDHEQRLADALKEREAQYKKAETLANLGHYSYDMVTKKLEWTDQLYRIYGLAPQSKPMTLSRFLSFIHPADKEAVIQTKDKLFHDKKINYTFRIVAADGEEKTVRSIAQLQEDETGKPLKVIGTEQDVTEKQTLIEQLQQSESLYKQAQALAHIGNWTWHVETGEVEWSDELYRIYEIPIGETITYESATAFVHPEDREAVVALLQECVAKRATCEKHHRIVLRNGKLKTIHRQAKVLVDSDGSVKMVGTTQDVTQQKAVEQELRDNQNFIKKIADASPTILYLFDVPQNRFSYINQEIYYVLGYTMEEIVEMDAYVTEAIYHPDDFHLLPERRESNKSFQHTDSMMQYECRLKGKEGQWCWVLVREVIFKTGDDGKVVQILGAALDITKRKDMEKTLLQNSFLLEQSNASLEEFAYVASHDLKEPLRKIATFGDRLMNTQLEKLTDDGKIYLKKIVDASQRMQVMINDLLSISMISGDRSFDTHSLQSILEDVLQTLEYKIEQKAAIIEAAPLPEMKIVPSQFRQLFQNLIANSLKFVREDAQPHIAIKYSYVGPEEVKHLKEAQQYLKLEFTDNGIGFEEEYAQKIFAIFQRLHGRSEYEGTGIGLAICKKIVEHHGGIIYASAVPGQGATFTVVLPSPLSS